MYTTIDVKNLATVQGGASLIEAAASAGVYLAWGYIEPGITMPVMLGVLPGALLGAKVLVRAKTQTLRIVFSFVLAAMALKMVYNSLTGGL